MYISTLLQRNGQLNHQRKIHISARPVNDVLPYYAVLFQILTYVYMANFDIYRRRECSSTRLYSSGWVLSSQLWRIVNNYFTNESETDRLTAIAGWVQCWQREHVMHNVQLIRVKYRQYTRNSWLKCRYFHETGAEISEPLDMCLIKHGWCGRCGWWCPLSRPTSVSQLPQSTMTTSKSVQHPPPSCFTTWRCGYIDCGLLWVERQFTVR